ncbi:MAG: glycosyl hydrolase family 28 protein [Prolixibacteraceae bacterium]
MNTKHFPVLFLFILFSGSAFCSQSEVAVYPAVEGLTQSNLFSVKINGKEIWTEKFVSNLDIPNLPEWFSDPQVMNPQELHIAHFEGTGSLQVSVTVNRNAEKVRIRPVSRKIRPEIKGNTVSFTWEGPGQLVVETGENPPLFLFANPKETDAPSPSQPHVKYFGPGVHRPGYIELKDSETLYIAAGAVVYGGIRANGVSNIKVLGRGILDGNYEYQRMVRIENSRNIHFEGVTIRNGRGWTNTLYNCRGVEYNFVKVLGFGPSSDGINPTGSQRVRVTNCFMRCTDDCVAIKALDPESPVKDIHVENNIMIGFAYADGVTIGFETNAEEVSNVVVRDCDILLARGGSRVDGHSGFSIICDGPAVIHDILFEDIRVEKSEIKLFELHITNGTLYGEDPPGHIRDVTIRNVNWFHKAPIALYGFNENHRVQNVLFENCTVAGKPLQEVRPELFEVNDFVNNIEVKQQ